MRPLTILKPFISKSLLTFFTLTVVSIAISLTSVQAEEFRAVGPTEKTKLDPKKFLGAVQVFFDLAPNIKMSFDLPWHFCMVSENGIKFANFAAETYDPREWDGTGADASFEPGMDEEGRFVRVWIEHQSAARIVVRVQYALNNSKYEIAHDDLYTDSPYNKGYGDWAEEWFYVYPDSTYTRHMKIHSGLASMSQPYGFFREPPSVVHEFMEMVVIGSAGHKPTDDINTNPAIRLYKMFGNNPYEIYAEGLKKDIAYRMPAGPPSDYGDFRDANILLINSKSTYKPFTIGLPYGVKVKPYGWENNKAYPFATWTGYDEQSIGYISAIGHMLNYWHFRRTEKNIEQVYLHGMTNKANPQSDLLKLAWSWISAPELQMKGDLSPNGSQGKYKLFTYDQTQKAYIVPRTKTGPETINFKLVSIYDDDYLKGTMWLVNPVVVVKNWNQSTVSIALTIDGKVLKQGSDYRVGYEQTAQGKDLVVWIKKTFDLTEADDHGISVSITLSNEIVDLKS